MTEPASDARPAVWMISGAFVFSLMGALTHGLGPRCDWLAIALVRAFVMFVSAILIARAAGARLVVWDPPTLWMRSLSGSFSLVCSFYALTRLPVGDVLTLTNTYPLWIMMLTWVGGRQMPRTGDLLRVGCGLVGVALIEQPHLSGDRLAAAVALMSSVSTAVAMIGLHKLRAVDPRAVVAHFAGVASLVAGVWLVLRGWDGGTLADGSRTSLTAGLDATALAMLTGVGLTGTVGQIFLTKAYAAGAPARVAVLGLTQVVFGLGLDVVVWHRTLSLLPLLGTVLVLAPTAWLITHAVVAEPAPHAQPQPAREAA